jgi:hypothetical protein
VIKHGSSFLPAIRCGRVFNWLFISMAIVDPPNFSLLLSPKQFNGVRYYIASGLLELASHSNPHRRGLHNATGTSHNAIHRYRKKPYYTATPSQTFRSQLAHRVSGAVDSVPSANGHRLRDGCCRVRSCSLAGCGGERAVMRSGGCGCSVATAGMVLAGSTGYM